jgi:outer membrane cobalamin receptor
MRTLPFSGVASTITAVLLASAAFAGKPAERASAQEKQTGDETVFVTGSLIPQRIKRKPIGTTSVSPVRIIDRHEIDATGRRTTRGILIADPSVSAAGR